MIDDYWESEAPAEPEKLAALCLLNYTNNRSQ